MRLFIAMSFPQEVLRDLNEQVARLRPRLPSAAWVREETQHLTLAFLGEQPQSLPDVIAPLLAAVLSKIPPFEARLHRSGFFPHPRHPRVGWVGLEPEQPLIAIAGAVRDVVTGQGVALDGGEFRPHLTLLRIRDRWPPASIELFTRALHDYTSAAFTVDAVTLYESQLHQKGAIHTALRTFPLRPAS